MATHPNTSDLLRELQVSADRLDLRGMRGDRIRPLER
jgi:hypothetical protein